MFKRKLAGSFGIYTISNVVNAGIPFLLLPLLTNYLSKEDYGVLSNFTGLVNVLIPLVGLNLMASVSRQYVKEDIDRSSYISTGLVVISVLTLLFSLLMILFKETVFSYTGIPIHYLRGIAVYALFSNLMELVLAVWRMENKAVNYGFLRVGKTVIELTFAVYFVVYKGLAFEGSIYAMYIAMGLAAVASVLILAKKALLSTAFSKAYWRHILNFGLPLVPHALGSVVVMYSDKLLITKYLGLEATGLYSVGFLVGQIIGLLQNSFNQAWVPWAFGVLKRNDQMQKLKMVKATYLYFGGIIVLTLLLWVVTPMIYKMIGKDFRAGMELVIWVALGFAFNGMYKMVTVYIFYTEKNHWVATMSIIVAALNVYLNTLWIPMYGIEGAAMASLAAFIVQFLITWFIASRLVAMPWNLKVKQTMN